MTDDVMKLRLVPGAEPEPVPAPPAGAAPDPFDLVFEQTLAVYVRSIISRAFAERRVLTSPLGDPRLGSAALEALGRTRTSNHARARKTLDSMRREGFTDLLTDALALTRLADLMRADRYLEMDGRMAIFGFAEEGFRAALAEMAKEPGSAFMARQLQRVAEDEPLMRLPPAR